MKIKRFEDLKVWQLSHKVSIEVSNLVKTFPKDEKYDLAGQMRRAARSIPSAIVEGFGRFHFNDKLTFYERGRASLKELRNHFAEARENEYVNDKEKRYYDNMMSEIEFLLNRMMSEIRKHREEYEVQKKARQHK